MRPLDGGGEASGCAVTIRCSSFKSPGMARSIEACTGGVSTSYESALEVWSCVWSCLGCKPLGRFASTPRGGVLTHGGAWRGRSIAVPQVGIRFGEG